MSTARNDALLSKVLKEQNSLNVVMVKNVKLSSENVRWYLIRFTVPKIPNITSVPRIKF